MANALKLREAVQVIRENQHRWNQVCFVAGRVNAQTTDWRECGTTMCLAGWGSVLNGWLPHVDKTGGADGLFYLPEAPRYLREADLIASDVFELTSEEAYYLFYLMTIHVDVLSEAVERVIRGDSLRHEEIDEDEDFIPEEDRLVNAEHMGI